MIDPAIFARWVTSNSRREKLAAILDAENAPHRDRLWFAGFLFFCGATVNDVFELVDLHHGWTDYNPRTTAEQLASVWRSAGRGGESGEVRGPPRASPQTPPPLSTAQPSILRRAPAPTRPPVLTLAELDEWLVHNQGDEGGGGG